MAHGKKLRLPGKGEKSPYGGPAGDLYIKASVSRHPEFTPDGQNLVIERTIKISEALLGTTLSVPTLEEKQLSMKIPPGTSHNTKLRLAGHGLPSMKGSAKGDLFVKIIIEIPKKLGAEQKEIVKKLSVLGL
jgi:curved DNA-binding protein